MTAVAVIDLVMDARRYAVCAVAFTPRSGSANPNPVDHAVRPSSAIAIDNAGARLFCIHALAARAMRAVSIVESVCEDARRDPRTRVAIASARVTLGDMGLGGVVPNLRQR